jgi:hypothetical protein
MNNPFLIVLFLVVFGILIFKFKTKATGLELDSKVRPDNSSKPVKQIENDKVIIVKSIKFDYLKKAIEQFCNMYNQEQFQALPRLLVMEDQFLIIFPYDIDFERYCYFINYLENPFELILKPDYKPDVMAWCTTKAGDAWITNEIIDKNVMIYIPDWDDEHDNVYLTTQDNIGFKMGFALGHSHKKLDKPVMQFESKSIDLSSILIKETIDFE